MCVCVCVCMCMCVCMLTIIEKQLKNPKPVHITQKN